MIWVIERAVCYLIAESPEAHGVHEAAETVERPVWCEVRAMTLNMAAEAQASGLSPDVRLRLARSAEYQGEKLARFDDELYDVSKATPYESRSGIELLLKRRDGNAADDV